MKTTLAPDAFGSSFTYIVTAMDATAGPTSANQPTTGDASVL